MYILNKNTNVIHEVDNSDIIKYAKLHNADFLVTEDINDISNGESSNLEKPAKSKPLNKMNVEELKSFATENGIELPDGLTKAEMVKVIEVNGSNK
jgi:hypothetical protein